jgi:D-alanine-D-alanine ligase
MDLAVRCHRALACDGMSRTDMIVGPDGPVVLEVNTIPGLTEESLLPKAAAAAGIALPALLDRLVDLALQQAAARRSGPSALHAPAASAAARGGAPRRRRETANEATA